jgi:hypothetical protein
MLHFAINATMLVINITMSFINTGMAVENVPK